MILTAVLTAVLTSLLIVTGILIPLFLIKRRIERQLRSFITQPDEKTPSQLATFVDQIAFVFSQRLVNNLKTTVMGMNSVDAKNERKAEIESILGTSPGLLTLANLIPGAKRLLKNPAILSMAAAAISKMTGNNGKKSQAELISVTGTSPFKL